MVPSPWERRSFLRGMRQGGAVAREMSSGNQVRVGQWGATSRTCSSSSLSLHNVCASRLTGGNAYLRKASCVPVRLCRGGPRSGRSTAGSGRTRGRQTGLPELPRIDSRSAGSSRDGVATLRGMWAVVRARRPHDWAAPGCEQHAVTWTACDSRGGDGGRAVTCGVIVYPPAGWYTRPPQCCPCRLADYKKDTLVYLSLSGSKSEVMNLKRDLCKINCKSSFFSF